MKKLFLLFFITVLPVFSQMEIPKGAKDCEFVKHSHFSLCYDEEHEQARWVAYMLTKEMIDGDAVNKKEYKQDKKVSTESAKDSDYLNSNFSRGHLAPTADFKFSQLGVEESYLYSNISPQIQDGFNESGGVWNDLEKAQRIWTIFEDSIYIVVGPVLTNDLQKLHNSNVSIPNAFYKAILDYSQPTVKAIAFVIPHEETKYSYVKHAVTIDSLENLIKFDLFSDLPDDIESQIETKLDFNSWYPFKSLCFKITSWFK